MLKNQKSREPILSPIRLLIVIIISIIVTEMLVMILIKVIPSLALWNELLIDSFLLAIILLPILYFFSFRPLTITIAERKQEKEKAVEIEEKFRKASMTSPDSIIISRLSDGMIISINEGFTKITGYSEKDAVGKTSFELNIWANPGSRNLISKELQEKGRVDSFETIFLKKDMGIVNVLFSASLINLDGVTHILSVTKDISLRKRFEAELGREQFLVNALMDNLPDHIYFKDRESRFIRINKAHAKFFGLMDSTQAVGKTDFDFFTGEHANQAFKEEQSIIRTGQLLSIEEKETHPDSPDSWVSTIKLPLRDKEGNTIGTFGISRDITVRKQKELESQVLFDITQGVTTTENLDELLKLIHQSLGKVVYAENCFVALYDNDTGLFSFPFYVDKIDSTPLPTSMGKSCMDYVFRTFKPLIISPKIFNQLKEQNEVELVGSSSPSWIGIPLRTPAGIIGVLVLQNYEKENVYSESDLKFLISIGSQIAISIERKKAEEELKLKNKLLQIIIAEKDKFFSILSHDLRGPLSAFVGATQILTEEIQVMNKDEIKMITQNMKSSAANIYNLLEDLLEWSCLRQGVMNFIPGKFNLKEKIRNCIDVLSESARRKGIEIVISSPDEMEVFADKHMFDTVVRNLVSNAIKFTPYGGKVSVTADFNNDHSIEIKISDSGIGMTPELKNKLFLINEKTNRKGTEGEPSTGLGLILCKEYIEKNGGKIWVESEEGKGSVFGFTIPEMIHECKSQAY